MLRNKTRMEIKFKKLASRIDSVAQVRAMCAEFPDGERQRFLNALWPYLKPELKERM